MKTGPPGPRGFCQELTNEDISHSGYRSLVAPLVLRGKIKWLDLSLLSFVNSRELIID